MQSRSLEGIRTVVSRRMESDGFLVAFTGREGGVSADPFASLNLGLRSGDDPADVARNRRRVADALGVGAFACVRQVHGARVVRAGKARAGAGFEDPATALGDADAIVTTTAGVALAVLAADCVPVALADARSGRVAVVHAGWRGIAAGVIGEALKHFPEPADVRAAIGPAICVDHYEVGEDVAFSVSAAIDGGAVTRRAGDALHLDLPASIARALKAAGVRNTERAEECTVDLPARFFSHRRDGERTGRQGLVAMRVV
ncbi:MAG TPA: peptidoglycan editing factor PgeF [Actinomycetota bacterium]|nr:peptidoglycan editing factor PgeF [Actinomycetota bacterium]